MIALQERHQKERLEAYLRSIGVDPNEIWSKRSHFKQI
jgi:lambda repressor-like predicted transcriptional regulator